MRRGRKVSVGRPRRILALLGLAVLVLLAFIFWPAATGGPGGTQQESEPRRGERGGGGEAGRVGAARGGSGPRPARSWRLVGCAGEVLADRSLVLVGGAEPLPLRSGPDGEIPLPAGLPTGREHWWTLEVQEPGAPLHRMLVRGDRPPSDLDYCPGLVAVQGTLGRIQGGSRAVLAGCEVLCWEGGEALVRTTTDGEGRWRFLLPRERIPGGTSFLARHGGRHLGAWRASAAGPVSLETRDLPLTVVVRGPAALPPGTRLHVSPCLGDGESEVEGACPTPGTYPLRVTPGEKWLALVADGDLLARGRAVAGSRVELTVTSVGVLSVSGRVQGRDGLPIADVRVATLPRVALKNGCGLPGNDFINALVRREGVTGEDGRFRLPAGSAGEMLLRLRHPRTGIIRQSVISPGDKEPLVVTFGAAAALDLEGLVVGGDSPDLLRGEVRWWLLDDQEAVYARGRILTVPARLCTVEQGHYELHLCHTSGASAFRPCRVDRNSSLVMELGPPRKVALRYDGGPVHLEWIGPGGVILLRRTLARPGSTGAPGLARALRWRRGPERTGRVALPNGVPPTLSLE